MVAKNEISPQVSDWHRPVSENPSHQQPSARENSRNVLVTKEALKNNDHTEASDPPSNMINRWSRLSPCFEGILLGVLTNSIVLAIVLTLWLAPSIYKIEKTADGLPSGTIVMFSGNQSSIQALKNIWLLCDGSAVSRSTYQNLFNVIGVTYGSGNGSDTFNLPDFRYRFPLGTNSSSSTQMPFGGSSIQTLTVSQIPSHSHTQGTLQTSTNGEHIHNYTDPGHTHGGWTSSGFFFNGSSTVNSTFGNMSTEFGTHQYNITTNNTNSAIGYINITINSTGSHAHSISGSTDLTGGSQPFDIMPPYQTIHFLIRI